MKVQLHKKLSLLLTLFFILVSCNDSTSAKNGEPIVSVPESNFVSAAWLESHIDAPNLVVVDCRGSEAYGAGHIPGAVVTTWQNFAKVTDIKTTEVGFGELLSAAEVGQKIAALGISKDDYVVTYAEANMGWGAAGRIAWMLQMAGIKVKVLEGGIAAWTGTKETTVQTPTTSSFALTTLEAGKTISTTDLNSSIQTVVTLDTRMKAEYDGDTTSYGPLDTLTQTYHGGWGEKAYGHVPGAVHAPFSDLFEATGMLKSTADLEALVATWGLTDKAATIVPYCTGGIRSAYMLMVLQDLGYTNVKNYDASFYGWTAAGMTVE